MSLKFSLPSYFYRFAYQVYPYFNTHFITYFLLFSNSSFLLMINLHTHILVSYQNCFYLNSRFYFKVSLSLIMSLFLLFYLDNFPFIEFLSFFSSFPIVLIFLKLIFSRVYLFFIGQCYLFMCHKGVNFLRLHLLSNYNQLYCQVHHFLKDALFF